MLDFMRSPSKCLKCFMKLHTSTRAVDHVFSCRCHVHTAHLLHSRSDDYDDNDNDYDEDGFRTCNVTGMQIHRTVENHVKVFGLTAVVALLVGGFFAITVAMTRWELVGLLDADVFGPSQPRASASAHRACA